MFFWPCIMNWLYINHQLLCADYYLFIKYWSPLHVSSLKCSSSGGYSCTHAAYGTVTVPDGLSVHSLSEDFTCFEPQVLIFRRIQLYTWSIWYCHSLSSWWLVGTQLEWELSLKLCTDRPTGTVTVPYAACVQLYPPEDEHLRLETCRGE